MQVTISDQKLQCPYCHDCITGTLIGCKCGVIFHEECSKLAQTCTACFTPLVEQIKPSKKGSNTKNSLIESIKDLDHKLMYQLVSEIKQLPDFEEAYSIAKENSKGPIWFIGSKVYNFLLERLNPDKIRDIKLESSDFDFLTTELRWSPSVPKNFWTATTYSTYGGLVIDYTNPYESSSDSAVFKFKKKDSPIKIDLVNLHKMRGIGKKNRNLLSYMNGVPLSIQSVAVDLDYNLIFGEACINSILTGLVSIHNKQTAAVASQLLRKNIFEYGREKATKLGLQFDYKSGY